MSKFSENKDMVAVFLFLIICIAIAVVLGQIFHDAPVTTAEKGVFTQKDSMRVEAIYEDVWASSLSDRDEDY